MIRFAHIVLFLYALPLASIADATKPKPTEIAACRAAFNAEDYGRLPISNELQQTIALYRAHWQQFCSGDQTVSLDALLVEAQNIEEKFRDVFHRLNDETEGDSGKRDDDIQQALTITLPSFIPAFLGWYMEYVEFRPVLVDFREASALGTTEDVRFFRQYTPLHGDTGNAPWFQLETDVSGCVRFGQYDWVGALKTATDLRKDTKSEIYLKLIHRFESDLLKDMSANSGAGACGDGREVVSDLLAVRDYMRSRDAAVTETIERTIDAIRAGQKATR